MFPAAFEYFAPTTVEEVLDLLARHGDDAKILAGGQSLVPMMKLRIASPRYVIDLNRVQGLGAISRDGDVLIFGALARHAEIGSHPIVCEQLPLMADAARLTADVQVRNRGTIGGSLAHADPAGDWPTALLALDADVVVRGPAGSRAVALSGFIQDAYTTDLAADEIVVAARVPVPGPSSGGAYAKFEKRAGDFAVASVAVQVELADRDQCRRAAISLGAVGVTPVRATEAERALVGVRCDTSLVERARALVEEQIEPFADTRGSTEYKRHLAGVLFQRAFAVALDRARGATVPTLQV
ncbi:MAG: xanthine dehydrogenase family protein subunit M [Vicinamibacterales bacterium]